ncbi:hypothetical protein E2C06_16590 [Dankookia rubra]|uniref:Uncharacterized protein n=1 Tax=Dankookia rubra TaxID=1442381 RepID=A0A4R5QFD1_9PROT|nr:DUF6653 family protein [Dankookia rubra]TDH61409.1 hypothetical protein E2C06_16590 [Dankookia rubra]
MAWEARLARAFRLDDAGWVRHANPWSGWTRMAVLPLLALAGWSRAWIGWWALLPLVLLLGFLWLNPRLFPPPCRLDAWISRSVLGERLWVNRDHVPVPARHRRLPHWLAALSGLGGICLAYGVAMLEPWPSLLGLVVAYMGKLWFLDRMVWLHQDMDGEGR